MNPTAPPPPKCGQHPDETFTGFCPSCLCERLSVLDSQSAAVGVTGRKSASAAIRSLFNGPALRGKASTSSLLPELRRTKSFSDGGGAGLGAGGFEPQRKSCDVRGRSTLFSLFDSEGRAPIAEVVETEMEMDSRVEDGEIQVVQEEEVEVKEDDVADVKTMKDYIEIDTSGDKKGGGGGKDLKELAGSFWSAASVFSKKLRAWTKKKKRNGVQMSGKKGNAGRNYRDTQSEIADYGFGRRSCDSDPRFSLDAGRYSVDVVGPGRYSVDAGRMSFDDPRGSFDEPRASWDGYLIGGRSGFPKMIPPMVSVVEDAPVVVARNDMQIPVEEPRRSSVSIGGDDCGVPGGAAQTKDYYSDSSSKRRKSLDRSSSIRKTAAAVVAEMDEMRKVASPPNCPVDYLNNNGGGPRIVANDRGDLNASSNSLRDNYSESFDLGFRDNASIRKGSKKSRRWKAWNILSLLYRRSSAKDEDDDRYSKTNGVGRSLSESWQDYRKDGYGRNVLRSNSSVSWRNSNSMGGSFGSRKKKDEFVLERNRSARYSPKHGENNNGMLRFYLTPMRGSRRGSSGKPKPPYSHSFARNMLRLY